MHQIIRSKPPKIARIDKIDFLNPTQQMSRSGIPVYLLKDKSQNVFRLEFVFKAGSIDQNKPLVAQSVAHLMKCGTRTKSAAEINNITDFYGASLQTEPEKDIISVSVECLTKHINPIADLIVEIISQSVFPEEEIRVFLNNMLQKHISEMKKVSYVARMEFNAMIFGENHPYGTYAKELDYLTIQRPDIADFYNRFINPANAICIVTGNFPDEIVEILDEKIERYGWASKPIERGISYERTSLPPAKRDIIIENTVQFAVRIGKISINRRHPSFHKLIITNTLLGGFFGSRLMQNIRQQKGYSYGIGSGIVTLFHASYFFISSQVGKDVKDQALNEIYNELKDLRVKPVRKKELELLKNFLSASLLRSFDGPFSQSGRFKELVVFGLDYSHYIDFLHVLTNIKSADIQDTAEKYLHENEMFQLVVG